MKPTSFLETELSHLALTQYYRWYQIHERPLTDVRLRHAMDLLADDVLVKSVNGSFSGRTKFMERLALYEGWQNAAHVQYAAVTPLTDTKLALVGHVLYQNIRPDGSRHSFNVQYDVQLALVPDGLPVFTYLKLTPTGDVAPAEFEDAYPRNRVASFMHYWLYCMETHNGDATKLRELYAPEIELRLATANLITTWEQFAAWIESTPSRIRYSSHHPRDLKVQANADGTFSAEFTMDWRGISAEGEPMIAELHHKWLLEDNPDNRFPALRAMQVETWQPFQVSYSF